MPADEAKDPAPRKSVRRESSPATTLRRPQKMSEHTARKVVADIIDAGLGAGDRLPSVPSMAENYGVGYASVREALRMLESIGLIHVRPGPNGGPVVNDRDGAEFSSVIRLYCQIMGVTYRHIIAARQALEPVLVRELAIGGTSELQTALLEVTSHEMGPGTAFRAQARNFHDVISSYSASNPVLSLFARAVGQIYREFIRAAGPRTEPADRPEVHAEHRAIAEAVAAEDGARAEQLMSQHMAGLAEYVEAHYSMTLDSVIEWV
ncbi:MULTISPECIES: FCD domain-containing protein [unclassified Rhodococcus (in: high G+C Gram-positive bacteria)]|uniref:FadR/GntR family transcriptional regulator n=1 Tax=Rhodococcus sp. SJ-3 TaxID=3454628 RepID=UPI003F79A876